MTLFPLRRAEAPRSARVVPRSRLAVEVPGRFTRDTVAAVVWLVALKSL